jgi:hypothetical protein
MKKNQLLFLILIFFSTYSYLHSQAVTFLKKGPVKGEEKYFSFLINQNLEITAFQNNAPTANFVQSSKNIENKNIKILDVDNDKIKKVEVFFEKMEETNKDGDVESTKVDPISGKTYLIEDKDGNLEITYPDGKIPADEEIKYITDNEKELDQENYLDNLTINIGDRVPALESVIKNQFLNILNTDKNDNNISVYFKELRDYDNVKCGVFDIKIDTKAPIPDTSLEMNISLAGEILITVDSSNPIFLKLEGPISMDGTVSNEGQTMVMKGKGSISYDLNIKKIK